MHFANDDTKMMPISPIPHFMPGSSMPVRLSPGLRDVIKMAVIIRLADIQTKDTERVHEALADLARRGEILDSVVMYRSAEGVELAAFSGAYKANPGRALNAAMCLVVRLAQMQNSSADPL